MAESGDDHAIQFGQLVRERRTALGWSQEALAAEAFSNSDRKGYVSQIENGKVPDITGETVKKIANALKIDVEHIPHRLRWREAVEEIAHTSEIAQSIHAQQKIDSAKIDATAAMVVQLVAESQSLAKEFGLKEGLLIGVARKYAEGNADNFDAALKSVESALEAARDMQERGRLPSNLSAAVDAVIAQVNALNNADRLDEATKAIDDALAALDEEDARRRAERARLYDIGIDQAKLTNSPAEASRFAIARFDLDAPEGPEERFAALRALQDEWYVRGRDKGLNFDLEVSIGLAKINVARVGSTDERGTAFNDLGNALFRLGERENGTSQLEAAVKAYKKALEKRNHEREPLEWATTQNNLGNVLQALGQRESGTDQLEEAVAAYQKALEKWNHEREPLEWATTQNNLGATLNELGKRENSKERLEAALLAYQEALKERTRERVPLDWAMTQNNLGIALANLGSLESDTSRLEAAVSAYNEALTEFTRDRVPLPWAQTKLNLGNVLLALGTNENATEKLEAAVTVCKEALMEMLFERVPLQWAIATGLRASAWTIIAFRTRGVKLARQALDDLTLAAHVSRDGGHIPNAEYYESHIDKAREVIRQLEQK